jgi:predicted NAD-dependent protein-ADP-ribosyltransferase YbiA (DUF1768 family)
MPKTLKVTSSKKDPVLPTTPRETKSSKSAKQSLEESIAAPSDRISLAMSVARNNGQEIIKFGSARPGPNNSYDVFSNMKSGRFEVKGVTYRSNEHFYHSEKFRRGAEFATDAARKAELLEIAENISDKTKLMVDEKEVKLTGGKQAKDYAKSKEHLLPDGFLKNEWDGKGLKNTVMKEGLMAKFGTREKERLKLLSTGDSYVLHWTDACPHFGYHPNNPSANGEEGNHLGRLLMEVREELRKKGVENEGPVAEEAETAENSDDMKKAEERKKANAEKEAKLKAAHAVLEQIDETEIGEEANPDGEQSMSLE